MTRIISIEGNIGSGKSTFVKKLEEYYKTNMEKEKIYFLQEPVDIWNQVKNKEDKNIIECYYENQEKYAFPFQMMAYISRIHLLKEALKCDYDIIITERCIHTDKNVFAQMLFDEGKIDEIEFKVYTLWFDEFLKDIPNIEIIYLKTEPNISNYRVIKRSRKGEIIPLEYLKKCHDYHEKWLENDKPIFIIDGNEDMENYQNYLEKIKTIVLEIQELNKNATSDTYTMYFDGASRGNPGISGIGYVIYSNSTKIYEYSKYIGDSCTNNYAEYTAIYEGIKWCLDNRIEDVIIKGDSLLIINQLKGIYKISSENLKEINNKCSNMLKLFKNYDIQHIDRSKNSEADKLANLSLDNLKESKSMVYDY